MEKAIAFIAALIGSQGRLDDVRKSFSRTSPNVQAGFKPASSLFVLLVLMPKSESVTDFFLLWLMNTQFSLYFMIIWSF